MRIDSAFRLINAGQATLAIKQAQTLNPSTLPVSLYSHASRLALAGLRAQPGNHAWLNWAARFDTKVWIPEEKFRLVEEALDAGESQIASSLLGNPAPANLPALRQKWEIFSARLKAASGNWKETETRLGSWKNNPDRREGSGEILFWQGWVALHQHHLNDADTLFTLASAYADEDASQKALEYRQALMADSTPALYAYIRGLMESPLPDSLRLASLKNVPTSSPLHPYSLWEAAQISERTGDKAGELQFLEELAMGPTSLPGRKAAMHLARFQLEPNKRDSAMAAYERLLLHYQQGVPSEFAKSRVKRLRD